MNFPFFFQTYFYVLVDSCIEGDIDVSSLSDIAIFSSPPFFWYFMTAVYYLRAESNLNICVNIKKIEKQ